MKNVPSGLRNLKSKVNKLDTDKLVPITVDLTKLSDVVKNDVVKKDVYKIKKIKNIENKISDITNLATNASLNAKTNVVKCEITSITNLATTFAPTTIESKIPNVSDNTKINEIEKELLSTIIVISILLLQTLIS